MNPAKLISIVMLVSLTLGAGLEINRARIGEVFKNAGLLARALAANFVVVPLIGVACSHLFSLEPQIATGVILMSIAPGVPFVMMGIRKKGGNLALATIIALVFPLVSLVTVPLMASLMLPPGERGRLLVAAFVVTLLMFQALPAAVGVAIAERLPEVAKAIQRPVHLTFLVSIVALVAVLAPRIVADFGVVFGSGGILAMTVVVVLSLLAGWLFGAPNPSDRRTLSLGTALRNIGLCATVATGTFASETRVGASILVYLVVQFVLAAAAGAVFRRMSERALRERSA